MQKKKWVTGLNRDLPGTKRKHLGKRENLTYLHKHEGKLIENAFFTSQFKLKNIIYIIIMYITYLKTGHSCWKEWGGTKNLSGYAMGMSSDNCILQSNNRLLS